MNRLWVGMAAAALVANGADAAAQVRDTVQQVRVEKWLSISAGLRTELFQGNFASITVPQIDSTDQAFAGGGEWRARGELVRLAGLRRRTELRFDAGIKQLLTKGFQLRGYAPREHSVELSFLHRDAVGPGTLAAGIGGGVRGIADRPPMPLYLPPGFSAVSADATYSVPVGTASLYSRLSAESKDYSAPKVLPALDLLDRRSLRAEAGVERRFLDSAGNGDHTYVRLYGAYLHHTYPRQGLGVVRTDDAGQIGGEVRVVRLEDLGLRATVKASGTRSWSNSKRVEYGRARVEVDVLKELGEDTQVNLFGLWATKNYLNPQPALVPGEEADNAASVYAEVTRFLTRKLNAGFGGGWQRAETNVSNAYYRHFWLSFNLTYWP